MYSDLSFDKFRKLARNNKISKYNKVGFPDKYREGKEILIFEDFLSKINLLSEKNQKILDIGPGCSDLAYLFIDFLREKKSELTLIDSKEMLDLLPDKKGIVKIDGMFPDQFENFIEEKKEYFNVIFSYSVIQYVFKESSIWKFLDAALSMLAPEGYLYLGDIPNLSMKKRFLSSAEGLEFHQSYYGEDSYPDLNKINSVSKEIDDQIVLEILKRARSKGFHAWVLPQFHDLTFSNRREDIMIKKP